ncbi:MAG: antibiotic biosynthesis monooxygenase [Acidimicrobiia bacterium]|nr:antibiotic biosynthesis monooxygenase [Acidimicrobiia bacterium]
MSDQLPPQAVVVNYRVDDFDQWKRIFEAGEAKRAVSGFLGHHVNRAEGDPNSLSIYFAIGDAEAATAYSTSDEVKALMQEATVSSAPEMSWVIPVSEDIVWDRELPGVIVSHLVEDFDAWFNGYGSDEADGMRQAAGVVGHAVNRSKDNPNLAIIYHQAESFEALHALASSDELRRVMKEAGVTSEPEFRYGTGIMGKRY